MESVGLRCRVWALSLLMPSLALAAGGPASSGAHWWGVIVGVSQYEHLRGLDLEGPSQDVPLVLQWLHHQSVPRRQLTVLADQVAGADGLPTRSAILDALNRLPAQMHRGDVAFLYLAGHGSQQPQGGRAWSKADGMEEIFLPRDVGPWDGRTGKVQNALSGADFGQVIETLRGQGVFVWLVVDSCHSATLARAARIPHLKLRAVPPEALQEPLPPSGTPPDDTHLVQIQSRDLPGGYVAFYAAQTTESAPEMPLPAGELDNAVHGLFSFALLKALGTAGRASYREIAHRILAFYGGVYPATTPEFEGALDGPLGSPDAPLLSPGAWPARREGESFRIEAGRLNGVTTGALLGLSAALKPAPLLGLLEVGRTSLTESWASAVRSSAALKVWKISADRSEEVATGTVQVLKSSLDLTVRVALPAACLASPPLQPSCPAVASADDEQSLAKVRTLLAQRDVLPPGAALTDAIDSADLYLLLQGQRLYVLKASATPLADSAFIDLDTADAGASLADLMRRAVRAAALLRLSAEFPEDRLPLKAALQVREHDGRWRATPLAGVEFGSELSLQLQNGGPADLDVTVLSVTDAFGIVPVYPVDQESNLLRKGSAPLVISGWARSHGDTALVFIVEESRGGRAHDLGYLAQPGVTRAGAGDGLSALLERAGFSPAGQRGGLTADERHAAYMRVLHYFVTDPH